MLKIKDNTTKQELSFQNIDFWNNELIKSVLLKMQSIREGTIYINDFTVKEYNEQKKNVFPKSNASFVKQVRKLNREGYFDAKNKR